MNPSIPCVGYASDAASTRSKKSALKGFCVKKMDSKEMSQVTTAIHVIHTTQNSEASPSLENVHLKG
jgi:hypothetical protein